LTVDNGIRADQSLRTSLPDINAAGDVASFHNRVRDKWRRGEHEDNANLETVADWNSLTAKESFTICATIACAECPRPSHEPTQPSQHLLARITLLQLAHSLTFQPVLNPRAQHSSIQSVSPECEQSLSRYFNFCW
jgi:hypothetical protein